MILTYQKLLIMAGLIFSLCSSVFAYSGGSGTEADPYQIGTVADWNDLMRTPSDWDANFVMVADIDLHGVPLTPVGDYDRLLICFKGVFDGNGHVIRNAMITDRPVGMYIGVFGCILSDSQIRNLGVEDVNMSGWGRVGGLVGCVSSGTISNCYATGRISSSFIANSNGFGGLVGVNYGTITHSHASCDVNSISQRTGGLVGWNRGGTIVDCYATGPVNGDSYVGGLVGEYTESGDFQPVYTGSIDRCYAAGPVSGRALIGGLVGSNGNVAHIGGCIVTNSYATGAVTGNSYVGGLLGRNSRSRAANCYAVGKVSMGGGGLVGALTPDLQILNCFWDMETSEQTTSGGGTGKNTAEMKMISTFTSAGWDFNTPIWKIQEGLDYPRLAWENTAPVAEAGHDQTVYAPIDGKAEVKLDGSGSSDADGDALTYKWTWVIGAETFEANSVNPVIDLPVGVHCIQLVVNDGVGDSVPDEVVITVVGAAEAIGELKQDIAAMNLARGVSNELTAKLDAAMKKLEDGNAKNSGAALNLLEAFVNAVNAQSGKKISQEDAEYLTAKARQIIEIGQTAVLD